MVSEQLIPNGNPGAPRSGHWSDWGRVKDLVDKLHARHSRDERLEVDWFTRSTRGIHFYDSVVVLEKGVVGSPTAEKRGVPSLS